ncbi:hypothetical protein N7510_002334 [Penicillium lagena]|uniref:uncharacterized protein n=1 Tax=Penicillium lagena TaxID=94218 RepID=UPI0025403B06|nr:uncharacterized protein N7510_002334 [Penicillium lagena]KAJ5626025.1 hypothetical protein N7510_002334 [Penicillium lagena]
MSQGPRRGSDDTSPASRNRDYLGPRSDVLTPRGGPRQPSPLHTSSLPLSYLHDDSASSQSPVSARSSANPSPATNRSPMARVANAAFPAPPSSTAASSSRAPEMTSPEASADVTGGFTMPKQSAGPEPDRSETSSPKSTTSSVPGDRATQRTIPRTSSIDSAISSLSTPSHKSSFDANALSPADINNLISKAGSPEAVIIHLLKEKHHAASQNGQLWKLVDKQRTLILGLNKDLERAFKEKDHYKKKLKEIQQSAPPLPAADSRGLSADRHDSLLPKPLSRLQTQPANGEGRSDLRAEENAQATEFGPTSPTSPGDSKTSRKAPPAPLNLRQKENVDPNDSGSDYGDVLEVDELRSQERGRRKTREEDDQDREAELQDEAGIYDGAKPSKSGTSQSSRETASTGSTPVPRELSSRSPPNVGGAGSLGSILSSRTAPSSGRNMMATPKSPGLPLSPRPEDRPIGSPLPRMPTRDITNPMASPSLATGYNLAGLPNSPRAPNYPVPFSPGDAPGTTGRPGMSIPSIDPAVKIDSPISAKFSESSIYQGLVSEEYPGLLLPPNALPLIQVRVSSSRLRPSRNSYLASKPLDEEPVFTLSVISRSEVSELWRVEKVIGSLPQLDQQVKQTSSFAGKLPDRAIFSGHSPAKIDARRAALNVYFDSLLDTHMDETAALIVCQFLTNDAIEARDDETSLLKGSPTRPDILRGADGKPRKEGYLTKRGKNFGGWKARYFVLHGPELKYFESPGGAHMGTIRLHHAQIGKQSQNSSSQATSGGDDDADNQYRHAFLVLEPKKKDSSALVRHVLCSESDAERDAWVDALMEYVESASSDNESSRGPPSSKSQASTSAKAPSAGSEPRSAAKSKLFSGNGSKKPAKRDESPDVVVGDPVQGFSFDDAIAAEPPILGTTLDQAPPRSPRFPSTMSMAFGDTTIEPALQSPKMISAPKNGAIIQDVGAWGNKPTTTTSTKEKKRSIWGFRTRSSFDLASQGGASSDISAANNNVQAERKDPVRPVFGIPLIEAVEYCPPQGVHVELPAVVYRCIEYLHSQGAASEEGIFRLSGSNVVIKALKERFNTEGDIDFLAGDQYYDVHAVASLFKQYLRELPTTVLTRELHLDFLRVLELDEKQKKLAAFNSLVHRLPSANLTLLSALSQFLIEIVNNSDVNKMTVRNVGIVFAPTLNIPAPVFSMFLTDYDSIFGDLSSGPGPSIELTVDETRTLSADDIRSPRHQMFSEIPTPSYNQTSFRGQSEPNSAVEPPRAQLQDTGFIPMQPTYDQNAYQQQMYNQQAGGSAGFTSLNGMLVPNNPDDTRSARSKRRESSMLFMENSTYSQSAEYHR